MKEKAIPLPYHLQSNAEKEINKLIQFDHLEKTQNVEEDYFASTVVMAVKKDESVMSALGASKLNDSCKK